LNWYYKIGDSKVGPVNDKQILELAELGKITRDTMVWNERDAKWQSFREASGQTRSALSDSAEKEVENEAEASWKPYENIDSSEVEHYSDSSDMEVTIPKSESYCSRCFKKFAIEELNRYGAEKFCPACDTLFSNEQKKDEDTPRLPVAGFGIRLVAKLIDGIIIGIIGMLIYATAIFLLLWTDAIFISPVRMLAFILIYIYWLMSFIGYAAFFVGKYGATPGKLALGIKVVDVYGGKVGYIKALGRCCAEILSAMPFAFGYIVAAFDTEKRTLHDRICGTRVILKSSLP
jgi:uncharacterized RDD family membrane protein YckC